MMPEQCHLTGESVSVTTYFFGSRNPCHQNNRKRLWQQRVARSCSGRS